MVSIVLGIIALTTGDMVAYGITFALAIETLVVACSACFSFIIVNGLWKATMVHMKLFVSYCPPIFQITLYNYIYKNVITKIFTTLSINFDEKDLVKDKVPFVCKITIVNKYNFAYGGHYCKTNNKLIGSLVVGVKGNTSEELTKTLDKVIKGTKDIDLSKVGKWLKKNKITKAHKSKTRRVSKEEVDEMLKRKARTSTDVKMSA